VITIAIHPDAFVHANGERQSFSTRWSALAARAGARVREVDAYASDFFRQLDGCDGFMWRFDFAAPERLFARRLLAAVEHVGIPVFPCWRTAWHFEDKVAQHYLLEAAGLPAPRTWVFWNRSKAADFTRRATYPLVIKLAQGYRSANVRLLQSAADAAYWIDQLFGMGALGLDDRRASGLRLAARRARSAVRALRGRPAVLCAPEDEWQRGYLYLQEFLTGNTHDTRVTVIGHRAYAFRRLNRPGDFRASGSGRIDWNPREVDTDAIRLAFRAAATLGTQCVAVDVLRRGARLVIAEISYTFASWAVRDCPGHWVLHGDPPAALSWTAGQLAPEDAIFEDFLQALEGKHGVAHAHAR
jgi:glutathione synthase/RimK-type ligase-like ATP-grasp enzyme